MDALMFDPCLLGPCNFVTVMFSPQFVVYPLSMCACTVKICPHSADWTSTEANPMGMLTMGRKNNQCAQHVGKIQNFTVA